MADMLKVLADAQAVINKSPADARRIIVEAGVLDRASEHFVPIQQIYARSIYKDEDLIAPQKYEKAIDVLERDCALDESKDDETIGLAGAIYKRLWDHTGQRTHLEKSLKWYAKGYEVGPDYEGWCGVNTAFVSDLLGVQENRAGGDDAAARRAARFAESDRIRKAVLVKLNAAVPRPDQLWYHHASRAEAAFGLANFAAAADALKDANLAVAALPRQRLQHETTARQLAAIARIRFAGTPEYDTASDVIQKAFGINDDAVSALFGGKIGLAFSGGGFRASLFHIGVLAKLAELDLLRDVEVISCVSGGSVIGAFYYLALKNLLESGKTTHADYLQLVHDVETKFLAGVQKNVRTRIALSPVGGFKMAVKSGYSRSDVISELYQKHFYDHTAANGNAAAQFMSDLTIQPKAFVGAGFNPKYDNWRLSAKVPMLVLNATTMNTGHNWQFTATWMGESPQAISDTIDAIPRYRRMYYSEAPKTHQQIPIGRAVGASACVPGLFEPIALRELFPERTVRLVDGGVHDNQGLSSLLEQNCRVILISDASGQFQEQKTPGGSVGDSLSNSNSVLQARVREAQFDQLSALRRAGAIQGAMFIHLTKDLDAEPVSWVGAPPLPAITPSKVTSYGIDRDIQRKLAAVRTDLDSFSDAEAYALMTSGYRMTEHALIVEKCLPSLATAGSRQQWNFLSAEDALTRTNANDQKRMDTLLCVSNELAGKVWDQLLPLKVLRYTLIVAALAGAAWAIRRYWKFQLPSAGSVGILLSVIGALVGAYFGLSLLDKKRRYHKRLDEIGLGIAIMILGWLPAGVHLLFFDRWFLKHGAWKIMPKQPAAAPPGPRLPVAGNPPLAVPSGPKGPPPPPPPNPQPRDTPK
jgi:predicted acylesterase/phospholipase RssA